MFCFKINFIRRLNMNEAKTVENLAKIHLKLSDATSIINKILSPVMFFSFGVTFAMLCIFVFLILFIGEFWSEFTWFAIVNASLNLHMYLVMFGVIWSCAQTVEESKISIKLLFRALINSENDIKNKRVNIINISYHFKTINIKFSLDTSINSSNFRNQESFFMRNV